MADSTTQTAAAPAPSKVAGAAVASSDAGAGSATASAPAAPAPAVPAVAHVHTAPRHRASRGSSTSTAKGVAGTGAGAGAVGAGAGERGAAAPPSVPVKGASINVMGATLGDEAAMLLPPEPPAMTAAARRRRNRRRNREKRALAAAAAAAGAAVGPTPPSPPISPEDRIAAGASCHHLAVHVCARSHHCPWQRVRADGRVLRRRGSQPARGWARAPCSLGTTAAHLCYATAPSCTCTCATDALKRTGNEKFMAKEFAEAVELYTQALVHDPTNKLLLGNRSAARRQLKDFNGALEDATAAVKVAPDWPKVGVCWCARGWREWVSRSPVLCGPAEGVCPPPPVTWPCTLVP